MSENSDETAQLQRRRVSFYVANCFVALFVVWTVYYVWSWIDGRQIPLTYHKLPSVAGIPFAMIAAFVVVSVLEQTSGPIDPARHPHG